MHVFMHDGHADHEAPILLIMYARLAVAEEAQMREQFGAEFETYAARTPRFLPALRTQGPPPETIRSSA